jgi:hypothetical protein
MLQKLTKKQIRQAERYRKNKLLRTASKNKMIDALVELQNLASYNDWLTKSGLARSYFNELFKELLDEEKVIAIGEDGKHSEYTVPKIFNSHVLKILSCSFLHNKLDKINASEDREKSISEFNRYLGSLVTYVLKNYDWSQASDIFNDVLPMIGNYINLNNLRLPTELLGENRKQEPNVESLDWDLWRKLDSREFVTTVQLPKEIVLPRKIPKKNQNQSDFPLPCSGNCLCENASDGCMNRLAEAKLKGRKASEVVDQLNKRKNESKNQIIEKEAIDLPKFEKWLSARSSSC